MYIATRHARLEALEAGFLVGYYYIKSKFLILLAIGQVNLEIIDYFKKV